MPLSKKPPELSEELRIAARTRSKLCLEQTTIEDLQSEFVPPDVEEPSEVTDLQPIDEDWMQFLNDFTKPLSKLTFNVFFIYFLHYYKIILIMFTRLYLIEFLNILL